MTALARTIGARAFEKRSFCCVIKLKGFAMTLTILKKCNVCESTQDLSAHPYIPSGFLCKDHMPKTTKFSDENENTLNFVKELAKEPCYELDMPELKALRMDGLLPVKTYVFLALMIDNPLGLKSIDMQSFCQRWGIPAYEMLQAIGQLAKKGLINLKPQDIAAEIVTRSQRIENLENSIEK